jgi:hypothetical protein
MRKYEPTLGENIRDSADRAVALARKHKNDVQFTFNDRSFTVTPKTKVDDVVREFWGGDEPDPDPIPKTVDDALAKWDAGDSLFSVEVGGLGPGYEMAIQGLAFELMRELRGQMPPHGVDIPDAEMTRLQGIIDSTVHRFNSEPWGGFSGAQVGAATNLAASVLRRGYRTAMRDPAVKDRLIQVSKRDLRAPVPA